MSLSNPITQTTTGDYDFPLEEIVEYSSFKVAILYQTGIGGGDANKLAPLSPSSKVVNNQTIELCKGIRYHATVNTIEKYRNPYSGITQDVYKPGSITVQFTYTPYQEPPAEPVTFDQVGVSNPIINVKPKFSTEYEEYMVEILRGFNLKCRDGYQLDKLKLPAKYAKNFILNSLIPDRNAAKRVGANAIFNSGRQAWKVKQTIAPIITIDPGDIVRAYLPDFKINDNVRIEEIETILDSGTQEFNIYYGIVRRIGS